MGEAYLDAEACNFATFCYKSRNQALSRTGTNDKATNLQFLEWELRKSVKFSTCTHRVCCNTRPIHCTKGLSAWTRMGIPQAVSSRWHAADTCSASLYPGA